MARHVDGAGLLIEAGQALGKVQPSPLDAGAAPEKPSRWSRWWHRSVRPTRLIQADSLGEVLRSRMIDAKTTLILDLDRTLIRRRAGGDLNPADKTLWPALTESVEPITAKIVAALQMSGVPIFGLTARGLGRNRDVPSITEKQLAAIGVSLSLTSPVPDTYDYDLPGCAAAQSGIVYCGINKKGEVLARIGQQVALGRVVFIDDDLRNFPALFEAAKFLQIDMKGVYYRHDLTAQERAGDAWEWSWCKSLRI